MMRPWAGLLGGLGEPMWIDEIASGRCEQPAFYHDVRQCAADTGAFAPMCLLQTMEKICHNAPDLEVRTSGDMKRWVLRILRFQPDTALLHV